MFLITFQLHRNLYSWPVLICVCVCVLHSANKEAGTYFNEYFLIYFYLLICCAYLCVHLPFSNKEAWTRLNEYNRTISNSFTSKHLKGQLGIGTPNKSRKSVCNVFAYSRQSVGNPRQRHWERFSDLVTQLTMSDKLRNSKHDSEGQKQSESDLDHCWF